MATFCLIAGGCHNAWAWDRLVPELEARGQRAVAVELPTDDPDAGLEDYVAAVASAMVGTVGEVVAVGHSMAGYYLPLAAGRVGAGLMVFLGAIVPEVGRCGWEVAAENPRATAAGGRSALDELGRLVTPGPVAREVLFHDADDATATWAMGHLQPQGPKPMQEPFPADGWPAGVPAAYVLMTDDRITDPDWARRLARQRLGTEAIELPGSHSPFFTRPAELAGVLDDLARRHLRR